MIEFDGPSINRVGEHEYRTVSARGRNLYVTLEVFRRDLDELKVIAEDAGKPFLVWRTRPVITFDNNVYTVFSRLVFIGEEEERMTDIEEGMRRLYPNYDEMSMDDQTSVAVDALKWYGVFGVFKGEVNE